MLVGRIRISTYQGKYLMEILQIIEVFLRKKLTFWARAGGAPAAFRASQKACGFAPQALLTTA
jgi:hypothetical protein